MINKVSKRFIQGVVDLAVKEDRSVSFLSDESNARLRKLISEIDTKDCEFMKKNLAGYMVDVYPQSVANFILG